MGPQSHLRQRPMVLSAASPAAPTNRRPKQTSSVPGLAARQAAQRMLGAVIETRTSLDGLTDDDHGHPQFRALEPRDRALVRAILSSALRHRLTIERMLGVQFDRPLPKNATSLSHLLHAGAAQILFLDVPDHSAVDLAVESAKTDPRNARFAGMVNAVLRGIIRAKDKTLSKTLADTLDAPEWFVDRLKAAYGPDKTSAILAMHRLPAPLDLTVKSEPEIWAERLGGITLPNGTVRLEKFDGRVPGLPGFAEGQWWVQDLAASLPVRLMGDIKGKRVADLCAAPGGKTAAMALAGAEVTAVDLSASRLKRLQSNLARLDLSAQTHAGNLLEFKPAERFDAVLLDAPCSSTGTVRRHPDVVWTKTADDIAKLAELQLKLLHHAATLVNPGGTLLFSNCSLDPLEGEELAAKFLANAPDYASLPVDPSELTGLEHVISTEGYLRTTPADLDLGRPEISGMDGFFAARFRRRN
jgi:16S rRNA (cytosine967-C5)-methyltransferase